MDPIDLTEPDESEMISIDSDDSDESLQVCVLMVQSDDQSGPEDPPGEEGMHAEWSEGPREEELPSSNPRTGRPIQLNKPENFILTTPPTTAVRPREDEEEEQREAENLDMRAELQLRIKSRQRKMAEVKSSAFDLKVSLDNECEEINNVFSEVKKVVEDALEKALKPLKKRRERVKREGDDLLQRLERDIVELQYTVSLLERNPDLQIPLDETTDWSNTSVDTLERGLRSPLPMILLSNVRSLFNKMDKLRLLITNKTNRNFALSSVLCFTESWLTEDKPDSDLQLPGFRLLRADRDPKLSGKSKCGGICFYINDDWCSDVEEILRHCSPELETFFIACRPFYSLCEFTSFILVGVYIPPDANVSKAQRQLADQIQEVEKRSEKKSSTVIVLGDFNQAKLPPELSKYKQLIKCPTRGENTLDHCYSTISKAYRAVPIAPLGESDHAVILLIPPYILELNLPKPDVLRSKNWSSRAAVEELSDRLDKTFRTASNSLDEYTDAVTSSISVGEDRCIPTRTWASYNNVETWFTAELTELHLEKEAAFKSGDMERFRLKKYLFDWKMEEAKQQYS